MSAIHRSRSVLGAVAAPRFKVFLADECFVFVAFESLEALYGTDDFHDAMNFILKDLTVDQSRWLVKKLQIKSQVNRCRERDRKYKSFLKKRNYR